jgi:hypothetical protein
MVAAGLFCQFRLWQAMRTREAFSPSHLAKDAEVSLRVAQKYCTLLGSTRYLEVVEPANNPKGQEAVWRLVRDTGPLAPRSRNDRFVDPNLVGANPGSNQKAWQAIRILKNFDLDDLVITSGASRTCCTELTKVLRDAGLLRRAAPPRGVHRGRMHYMFTRDLGPVCPMVHEGSLWDLNALPLRKIADLKVLKPLEERQ